MMRLLTVLASITAALLLVIAPVMAQTSPPAPRPAPATPGPPAPAMPTTKEVEGSVKKVDVAAKSVQVSSGLLGLFGATLEVTDETKILVEGRDGSLMDIREGDKVKASYESRDGKNVAKLIERMPPEDTEKAAPSGSPARPVPPAGSTPPPAGQPKTQ